MIYNEVFVKRQNWEELFAACQLKEPTQLGGQA